MEKTIRLKKRLSKNYLLDENSFTHDHLFNMVHFFFSLVFPFLGNRKRLFIGD
ncbi:hypothetical protein O185_06025 [Photorhabdus temperata J3]|uniref:Uncharacterized protein n=1 Tax=Photorhabdus temperata J3 TaxID=1389415 RepID=U7R1B5_PHOTE|nr:hypothetical protein O185_06025 [Photorhabdus temperata J3]